MLATELVSAINRSLRNYNAWNEDTRSSVFVKSALQSAKDSRAILNDERIKQGLSANVSGSFTTSIDDAFHNVFKHECLRAYLTLRKDWEGFQGPNTFIAVPFVKALLFYSELYYLIKENLTEIRVVTIDDPTFKVTVPNGTALVLAQVVFIEGKINNEFVYIRFMTTRKVNRAYVDWNNIVFPIVER